MKRKEQTRGQKGITLLALVITIVIIIILATITMNMVFGDNGLVEKAEQAKNMTEEASQKEQGDLANTAAWLNEVIYGEGGNGGTNNIDTNRTDSNSIETNSIDTNTIEPPPVEIPDGDEEGAIIFGTPTWTGGKANVTISTETEYKIEYQVNKTEEGSWEELSLGTGAEGTVTGISHNDTIYARLTDGENYGECASITIKDSIAPAKANIEISKDSLIRGTPIEAKVTHTDNETGVDISKSKWVLNNSASEIGTDEGSYTGGTFTNNGETISIPTTVAGEYYLHVLTVDKAGNKTETVSNKITVNEITGSIDVKGPTWQEDGTAEIEITTDNPDVTIKYQVNDGEWKEYDGPITGLENGDKVDIKLTNGDEEGEEKTIEIKDENPPKVEVSLEDKSASEITVRVEAKDEESGIGGNEAYTYYIKKTGEPDSSYQKVESSNQATYTFTGLEQGTGYDIKVEVTDRAGNTGSGEIKEQTTNTIPGGEDSIAKGEIAFGTVSWANEEASITVSTNTEYTLQYQVNGTGTDDWNNINNGEKVTRLKHNDKVYARLTDGTNSGEPASKVVTDTIAPAKATINLNTTEAIAGETLQATVTHKDNESGVDTAKSKWVFNTSSTNIGTDEASYTGTFTANGETIDIPTKDVGTYYLHVLTVDKAGNKTETISEAVVLKKIEGDIEIGAPTWKGGTASITLSTTVSGYTIQYKINSGSWLNLADAGNGSTGTNGTVSGLNHNDKITVRLTNGSQYGDEVETTIKDSTAPKVVITANSKVTNSIGVSVVARDDESGMASTVTYTYYIKKTSENDYVQKASNTTNTYTFTGLTQGTSYDIKVEAVGDKAGNKGTGLLNGQTTSTLPGGETGVEQGAISFGTVTWSSGLAETSISTNTSYSIEYQVASGAPADGNWKTIANNGKVTGINNNSTVYARLTDGVNKGEYASITIKDTIAPQKASIDLSTTSAIAGQTITATVTHTDNETGVDISKSKWVFNTTQGNIGTDEGSYTGTFAANSETIKIPTSSTGTYYLHVLTVDKAGNKTETISEAVILEKITGAINKEGETTWSNETASIVVSTEEKDYTIEYKINDGEWIRLENAPGQDGNTGRKGTIPGLKDGDKVYTRLTNGEQTGEEIIFNVEDEIAPKVEVTAGGKDTSTITVNVVARDDESGMASTTNYIYYIKKSSDPDTAYEEKARNSTNSYTFTGLEQGTSYDIKVEVQGDKAGNKGTGLLSGQTTNTLPGGEDSTTSGAISFGSPSWSEGAASVGISTNTSYKLEYQVNGTDTGSWKSINSGEKVTGLKDGDTVYARLTDGTNYGEPASKVITDEVAPVKAIISLNKTTAIAGETITATVTHTDNESGVDISKSKWVFNTTQGNIGIEDASYTGTFTSNGEKINIPTSSTGTYYLHVLTVDKAGNKVETISEAVTLETIKGDITCSTPSWNGGEAEVTLSTTEVNYTIQYKINDGAWTDLPDVGTGTNGKVTGLNHGDKITARLTNGTQYGAEVTFDIKDETAPQVVITAPSKDTSTITVNVEASDNETGMADSLTYTYYIKKSSEEETAYVEKESNSTNSYTFTGLTQGTSYDIKVELVGDKAGNKGTNIITGQITDTLPGGDAGLEQGAISFGKVNWSGGTANTSISTNTSYQLEYQINGPTEEDWKSINNGAPVTGLNHGDTVYARLTDGINYGEYASVTITDSIKPTLSIVTSDLTPESVKVTATASDNETGLAEVDTYKYYLNGGLKETTTANTYTFQDLAEKTEYTIKVEAYDKAGNKAEQTTTIETPRKPAYIDDTLPTAPSIANGMTPVKYDEDTQTWIKTDNRDPEWYDYGEKKWANVVLGEATFNEDGSLNEDEPYSMLVWVPRYAYKITSGWHTNAANGGTVEVVFINEDDQDKNGIKYAGTYDSSNGTYSDYVVHPAFNYGNNNENKLAGIWVGKFETSNREYQYGSSGSIENDPNLTAQIKANANSWGMEVNNIFTVCTELNKASNIYGLTANDSIVDPHMMKNSEWGAVAYLSKSAYGKEKEEVYINNSHTTGKAGDSTNASSAIGTNNTYKTEGGQKASTNGNTTGIYDMSGGKEEYVAAYINSVDSDFSKGTNLVNAEARYKEIYKEAKKVPVAPDDYVDKYDNYLANADKYGDAVYETSIDSNRNNMAWYNDWTVFLSKDYPFLERGGGSQDEEQAGIFGYGAGKGEATSNNGAFRITIPILIHEDLDLSEGTINFGTPTWNDNTASVTLSSNTTYQIEYQVNGTEDGKWQSINNGGSVTGLKHGDTVYARLTDGTNYGENASITIKDSTSPSLEIEASRVTQYNITVTAIAEDNESGLKEDNTYRYFLNNEEKGTSTSNTYTFEELTAETEYTIKVEVYDNVGNKAEQEVLISTLKEGIMADEISKNPTAFYGQELRGYTCKSTGVSKWRIYYADETNIYIIADDYIPAEQVPKGQNGSSVITGDNGYQFSFENIVNDYDGANWINTNSKGKKWLSQYLNVNGNDTAQGAKAVAYMMDTNVWSTYAGEDAEYAMGGPTVELLCASYKDTHPDKYIEYGDLNLWGYFVKWNTDSQNKNFITGIEKDDFNSIYVKSDGSKTRTMWIASPSAQPDLYSMMYDGSLNYTSYDMELGITSRPGFRPIVCLKSDVQLEKQADGSYRIIKQQKEGYYGSEVKGYTCTSTGVSKWRIYYEDENNTYLIADDYISAEDAPTGQAGSSISGTGYQLAFNNVYNDYAGASWINTNSKAKKWLNQYLSANTTNSYGNIRAVAYLMDTNKWSAYAGEDAEYAIGAPTLEMLCASYEETHPDRYIECQYSTDGYNLKWNTDTSYTASIGGMIQDEFNGIYVKSDSSKVTYSWIAAPLAGNTNAIMVSGNGGTIDAYYYYSAGPGLRPIVCLKSGTKLEKQKDGSYMIVK